MEMNKKQYNNIIKNTLKRAHTEDSLSAARAVFKNMGVALPGGDMKEVLTITDSTPAVAVAGLRYYSYSYSGSSTTTMPSNYCGGSDYRDVTKHKMVLQKDGYYVCSRCGYRVKSPELEDRVVRINLDFRTSAHYIFDENNKIKAVRIFYP